MKEKSNRKRANRGRVQTFIHKHYVYRSEFCLTELICYDPETGYGYEYVTEDTTFTCPSCKQEVDVSDLPLGSEIEWED